jgi:hypothetical protein
LKISILALSLLALTACGDTNIYKVIIEECTCVQQNKDVLVICPNKPDLLIEKAKCRRVSEKDDE